MEGTHTTHTPTPTHTHCKYGLCISELHSKSFLTFCNVCKTATQDTGCNVISPPVAWEYDVRHGGGHALAEHFRVLRSILTFADNNTYWMWALTCTPKPSSHPVSLLLPVLFSPSCTKVRLEGWKEKDKRESMKIQSAQSNWWRSPWRPAMEQMVLQYEDSTINRSIHCAAVSGE